MSQEVTHVQSLNCSTSTWNFEFGVEIQLIAFAKFIDSVRPQEISVYDFTYSNHIRLTSKPNALPKDRVFLNQLSLIFAHFPKINIKIYSNGKFQCTGLKSKKQLERVVFYIKNFFKKYNLFQNRFEILTNFDPLLPYLTDLSDQLLYDRSGNMCGHKKGNLFYIRSNNCVYDSDQKVFIEKEWRKRQKYAYEKRVFDLNFRYCGNENVYLFPSRKDNLQRRFIDIIKRTDTNGQVYDGTNGDLPIGIWSKDWFYFNDSKDFVKPDVVYRQNMILKIIDQEKFANVFLDHSMSNWVISYPENVSEKISLDDIAGFLDDVGYNVRYDKFSYPAVNLRLFTIHPDFKEDSCPLKKQGQKKCSCHTTSLMFYRKGSVGIIGLRCKEDLVKITKFISEIKNTLNTFFLE